MTMINRRWQVRRRGLDAVAKQVELLGLGLQLSRARGNDRLSQAFGGPPGMAPRLLPAGADEPARIIWVDCPYCGDGPRAWRRSEARTRARQCGRRTQAKRDGDRP